MAIDRKTIIENYPLPVYNYQVIIDNSTAMSFSEISGLDIDYEHVLYRHGFSWVMGDYLIRAQRKPINVTLKRGMVKERSYLYDWMRSGTKKDIRIELCDEQSVAIVSWDIYRALPFKMDAPSFNASTNDIAIESLDLIAHDIKLTHH
ncbi:phage tail protein [Aquimarina algicola]|uniref:Phage tail protein n=1 Tax=Aquimarina algicola TaxID=2589995 RepID=A0A504JGU9_9FLAO|nr:phage tail protein [Aquimarina algicola]TPN86998.1 phage tail protein [Aquimarina algicola]